MNLSPTQPRIAFNIMNERLNRYVQRIESLFDRDRSRSTSPFNGRSRGKLVTKGPMINRIDTYIRYQHTFHVLNNIMCNRDRVLVKEFFAQLRKHQQVQIKQKKMFRFVPIKIMQQDSTQHEQAEQQSQGKERSHILCFRLRNLWLGILKNFFSHLNEQRKNSHRQSQVFQSHKGSHKINAISAKAPVALLVSLLKRKKHIMAADFLQRMKSNTSKKLQMTRPRNLKLLLILVQLSARNTLSGFNRIKDKAYACTAALQKIARMAKTLFDQRQSYNLFISTLSKLALKCIKVIRLSKMLSRCQTKLTKQSFFLINQANLRHQQKKQLAQQHILLTMLELTIKKRLSLSFDNIRYYSKVYLDQWNNKLIRLFDKIYFKSLLQTRDCLTLIKEFKRRGEGTLTPRSQMCLRKKEMKIASMIFLTQLSRLQNLVSLKYKFVLGDAFQKLSYRNQYCRAISKASQSIKCTLMKPIFNKLNHLRKHSYPSEIIYHTMHNNSPTKIKLLFKVLQTLQYKILIRTFARLNLKPTCRKMPKPYAIGLCRCLDRIYRQCVIPPYSKIKCWQSPLEQSVITDTTNIFNDVIEFMNERNENFEKIQTNYRKLKALASYEEDQPEHTLKSGKTRSVIESLKSKILYG